jgi:hypothetical protein
MNRVCNNNNKYTLSHFFFPGFPWLTSHLLSSTLSVCLYSSTANFSRVLLTFSSFDILYIICILICQFCLAVFAAIVFIFAMKVLYYFHSASAFLLVYLFSIFKFHFWLLTYILDYFVQNHKQRIIFIININVSCFPN